VTSGCRLPSRRRLSPGFGLGVEITCRVYRPRDPRKTPLYGLLGALSLAAYQTVKKLMAAAVEEKGFRPGMVQTFGEGAKFHPHVHALCSRGGWAGSGEWIPLSYVDEAAAEKLFRHKVLALLRRRGLLSQERIELLGSWRRSGFSCTTGSSCTPAMGESLRPSSAT
jgi:Putative transposase